MQLRVAIFSSVMLGNLTASLAHAATPVAFDVGGEHACISTDCGVTQCWGGWNNTFGELEAPEGEVIDIAVGTDHTCTLGVDGFPTCWGRNEPIMNLLEAPQIRFTDIEAGGFHTCGIRRANGEIACWGWERDGSVTGVRPMTAYRQLDAGYDYTCAVTTGQNAIDCWGSGVPGGVVRLLSWDVLRNHDQVLVTPERFEKVAVGFTHFCAVTTYGAVYCVGDNDDAGQLSPYGSKVAFHEYENQEQHSEFDEWQFEYPQVHMQIGRYVDVGASMLGTCALDDRGDNVCWGYPFDYGWGSYVPFGIVPEFLNLGVSNYCGWNVTTGEIDCVAESPFSDLDDVPELKEC